MTQELELDCLDQLEATPAILRGLMCDLSVEDTQWKPAPDRFSVAEVLAHLSHSEGHCYRTRVGRFVSEELPEFDPDDAQMYLELYRNANAEDAFDDFEEQRETNVEYLRTLPRSALVNAARGTRRPAKSPCNKCCMSGPCTIWDISGRSLSW